MGRKNEIPMRYNIISISLTFFVILLVVIKYAGDFKQWNNVKSVQRCHYQMKQAPNKHHQHPWTTIAWILWQKKSSQKISSTSLLLADHYRDCINLIELNEFFLVLKQMKNFFENYNENPQNKSINLGKEVENTWKLTFGQFSLFHQMKENEN